MRDGPNLDLQRAMRKGPLHPAMAMLPRGVRGIFDLMGVAEAEIARAKRGATPEVAARVHASFKLLCPTDELGDSCNPRIYEAHCRELLARVVADAPESELNLRTKAEVMMLLSQQSLKAPLNTDGCDLYAQIFHEIFPDARGIERAPVRDQAWGRRDAARGQAQGARTQESEESGGLSAP